VNTFEGRAEGRVAVVVVTRNRCHELTATLGHLRALPENPRVVVVDNASADGTPEAVRSRFPEVEMISLSENVGAAGRNVGVGRVNTPYVAFSDDDSWWRAGSLSRAADLFDSYPRLGLLAARTLVGLENREDPICVEMSSGTLPAEPGLPGPPVLGFLACASIVRRSAYLEVGGFDPHLLIAAEEQLLATDFAAAGWGLAYVDDVVAHHYPSAVRDASARRRLAIRNDLWFALLRRPASTAIGYTLQVVRGGSYKDPDFRAGLLGALGGLPWAVRERRVVPNHVESKLRILDRQRATRANPPTGV
jgi:GT2 family glycosyltransferase